MSPKYALISLLLSSSILILASCGGGGGGGSSAATDSDKDATSEDLDGDGVNNSSDVDRDNNGLIEISSLQQLDWVRHDLLGTARNNGAGNADSTGCPQTGCNGYELIADLDFDTNGDDKVDSQDDYYDYDGDGSNNGWLPIGNATEFFAANFNGNNHTIANLYINRTAGDAETAGEYIGLFGYNADSQTQTIKNILLDKGQVTGARQVGSLFGEFRAGAGSPHSLHNCKSTVAVNGSQYVGGLVGIARSVSLYKTESRGAVHASSDSVGGLIGSAVDSVVSQSSAYGSSSSDSMGDSRVGGLVGVATGSTFSACAAYGNVSSEGSQVGGLIGYAVNTRVNLCLVKSAVTSFAATSITGGLVGYLHDESSILYSSFQGDVIASGDYVGGLVGLAHIAPVLTANKVSADVNGANFVGGLVGSINMLNAFVSGDTGYLEANLATGSVSGDDYVGGLVGISYIVRAQANYSTGSITAQQYVGGLVGDANVGTHLYANYSAGSTNGASDVGGLVGFSDTTTYIDNYYAIDNSGQANAIGTVHGVGNQGEGLNATGATLAELQCPTADNNNSCAAVELYDNWSSYQDADSNAYWHFGSSSQLPGLLINGIVYRDSDGDGDLD
ncbi:hypothetical protein [Dasania marina]|uniref:hypothetical protein n=1 Tax=Dasania marina TaxID=471499 RepID=UPI000373B5DA|nr:hypothetical protein [Dasania marina]